MTGRRILVTGASGFVGRHLRAAFAASDAVAHLTCLGSPSNREPGACVPIDLLDRSAIAELVERARPEVVVHLAGQASVGLAHGSAADVTWAVNVSGTLNLALAVARHVAPDATLLFASSGEVYGRNLTNQPATEGTPAAPITAYAKSKAHAECLLADVLPDTMQLIVARPFNHTGVGQREDFVLPSFAAQVARIEAGLQPPSLRIGSLDVSRDFLDVRDVVNAYLALLNAALSLPRRLTVNVASGEARPMRALLDEFCALSRVPFTIEVDTARLRPAETPIICGYAGLLREVTDWRPKLDMRDTLSDLLGAARQSTKPTQMPR